MSVSHTKYSKFLLTFSSVFIGYGLKKLLKMGWQKTYQEDPPGEIMSKKINWFKLILWTFFSGLILRLIKVGIKRFLAVKLKQENLLVE